jgi:tRNA(Arg) A34 adenosine deaminase TadA
VVVVDCQIAGRGVNRVVELHDPAAHAEIMALRAAGRRPGPAYARGRGAVFQQRAVPDVPGRLLLGLR